MKHTMSGNPYSTCRTLFVAVALALIGACTFTPQNMLEWVKQDVLTAPAAAPEQTVDEVLPSVELTEELLYQLLVAEIAGKRNRLDVAVKHYLALARTTRDPRIINRATRIAIYARDDAAAREAATLWIAVEPDHPDPRQVLAVAAIREGDTDRAIEHLKIMLNFDRDKHDPVRKLWMIVNLINTEKDTGQIRVILRQLMADRDDDVEMLFAYAQILVRLNESVEAREVLERVLERVPDNQSAVMTYVSVLNRLGEHDQALEYLKAAIADSDEAFDLRVFYARTLIDTDDYDGALKQFELLVEQQPANPEILLSLGLLSLQMKRLDDAEVYFTRLSETKHLTDDASFYLGRIAEEKNDWAGANAWYRGITEGQYYFSAQVRIGVLFGKQNKFDSGVAQLEAIITQTTEQKHILTHAKAGLFSDADRHDEAMRIYDEALQTGYDSDLLYARAMLAEKMDRLDAMERDLKAIIDKEPDNSQALNALGYTLADRTGRYDEAFDLIQRALEINPDSHYILDSMGWVLYRRGQLDEAVEFLQRALNIQQDAEIAAHLGEVLWIKGEREAARAVWDTALEADPNHDILRHVINRLNP